MATIKAVLIYLMEWIIYLYRILRRAYRRMPAQSKRIMYTAIFALIIGGILGGLIGKSAEEKKSVAVIASEKEKVRKEEKKKRDVLEKEIYDLKEALNGTGEDLPWNLTLVNWENPMEEGFVPELFEVETGVSVDKRIADDVREMLADARAAGLSPIVCSSYRSVQRQESIFSDTMKEHVKSGLSYWEAYEKTTQSVAVPGTSEHAIGLALDIISNQYTELDEKQKDTAEAKWFAEHCHEYGFILRYPPEKTTITGIIYEPWHYRYVGKEHAKQIYELGVTLEEYLQNYYQPEGGQ